MLSEVTTTEMKLQQRVRLVAFLVFALMIAGVVLTIALTPRLRIADQRTVSLEDMIPKQLGEWTAFEGERFVLPDPEASRLVDEIYNSILARSYKRANGDLVTLVIAYGGDQSDALQLHRPEVCYVANGFRVDTPVLETKEFGNYTIKYSRVGTKDTYSFEPVSYWMRVGDRQVSTTLDRQAAKLFSGLQGIVPDGVLVRLSSRTRSADSEHEYAVHDEFVAALIAVLDEEAVEFLLGAPRVKAVANGAIQ